MEPVAGEGRACPAVHVVCTRAIRSASPVDAREGGNGNCAAGGCGTFVPRFPVLSAEVPASAGVVGHDELFGAGPKIGVELLTDQTALIEQPGRIRLKCTPVWQLVTGRIGEPRVWRRIDGNWSG